MQTQQKRYAADFTAVCANELQWSCGNPHLNGCREIYQAAMRLLVDLARLNWRIQEDRFGIELQAPDFLPRSGIGMEEIRRSKRTVRDELTPLRQAQLQSPAACDFIKRMENPTRKPGRKPIQLLIADGREVRARLNAAIATNGEDRVAQLGAAIQPYLQLVEADEPDAHTGIHLGEIWRYFRYTWSKLRRAYQDFAAERQEALEEMLDADVPQTLEEAEAGPYGVPLAEEVLVLEKKVHDQQEFRKARAAMSAKKRAYELARLLQARLRLREVKDAFLDPKRTATVLYLDETRSAISMALLANKSRRVGSNLLEITTCGAIPPYNNLLAGKLTALLLLSPQVADDYRRRYGSEPSIISSLLKNKPLVRDSTLVYLGTTSLYALGSSQYERLKLPAGIITPEQPEIRFERIGHTSGYGTVQFAPETVAAVEEVVKAHAGFRDVNSIFGEGPSPRLRKLRAGLKLLGFDPENLLRHNQHRLIYGMALAANAREFLRGETDKVPDYLKCPGKYRDATERIAAFWSRRWLASRLNHIPAIESLAHTPAWKLSDQVALSGAPDGTVLSLNETIAIATAEPSAEVEFWRSLAHAGPEVCSDELTEEQIERLHVKRPLEDFLMAKIKEGVSIVLTGNAGDGKTHLLRRLHDRLMAEGVKVFAEPDATAAMKKGDLSPVLDAWRKASLSASQAGSKACACVGQSARCRGCTVPRPACLRR